MKTNTVYYNAQGSIIIIVSLYGCVLSDIILDIMQICLGLPNTMWLKQKQHFATHFGLFGLFLISFLKQNLAIFIFCANYESPSSRLLQNMLHLTSTFIIMEFNRSIVLIHSTDLKTHTFFLLLLLFLLVNSWSVNKSLIPGKYTIAAFNFTAWLTDIL